MNIEQFIREDVIGAHRQATEEKRKYWEQSETFRACCKIFGTLLLIGFFGAIYSDTTTLS